MKKQYEDLLKKAEELAPTAECWADFSNALFDPITGLVSQSLPTEDEREAFTRSAAWKQINHLMDEVVKRTGLIAGATPKRSGKFVVRLPVSLHESLAQEAQREGVSLNQLVVAKLSVPLQTTMNR